MIGKTTVKVCGLTSAADAKAAADIGADYLGFIFYPKSPRYVSPEKYRTLAPELPAALQAGFDRIQIHFNPSVPLVLLREWSELVGAERLWLVPKLPPGTEVSPLLLPLADTFLLDTYHAEKFGGTGQTGDWASFRHQQGAQPDKTWILSGGLTPENVAAALAATGAKFIDVNSGVESAPGVKDHAKLAALAAALR